MALTKDNTIFVYRDGDADSLALAQYYQSFRGLAADQLIAISCSATEILADYATFQTEVENPIYNALTTAPLASRDIFVIILGLNVPGGFYDGTDVISSVSRIMNIKTAYSKQTNNYFYIQRSETDFESGDEDYSYVVSRIDAPTLLLAKKIINNTKECQKQFYANGKIYVDPYFGTDSSIDNAYKEKIINFLLNNAYKLNSEIISTKYKNSTTDISFPFLQNDSFFWGGKTSTPNSYFFDKRSTSRYVFQNISSSSASSVRNVTNKSLVLSALEKDYCSGIGSMSASEADDFLDIKSFFYTLLEGKTLGEAFLFSLPYQNWTLTLIGDPLLTIKFPGSNSTWSNCSGMICKNCANGTPSELKTIITDTEISNSCVAGGTSSFKLVSNDININGTHFLTQIDNCTWAKTYTDAIRKQIFSGTECSGTPATDEIKDLVVKVEISKVSSGVYLVKTIVSDAFDEDDISIYFFNGSYYFLDNECLNEFEMSNSQKLFSYDDDANLAAAGKDGTATIIQNFCNKISSEIAIDNTEGEDWNNCNKLISKNLASYKIKSQNYEDARDVIVYSSDIATEVDLLYKANNLYLYNNNERIETIFKNQINYLFDWAKTRFISDYKKIYPNEELSELTLHQFLSMKGYKVSQKILDVVASDTDISDEIKEEDIYEAGFWEYEHVIEDEALDYAIYNFELDIASDEDFNDIVYSLDTSSNVYGWYLELDTRIEGNIIFEELQSGGVPSSNIGKKIKFSSPVSYFLTSGQNYYFRFRQKTTTENYPYTYTTEIIFT